MWDKAKTSLRREWRNLRSWRDWFDAPASTPGNDLDYATSAAQAVIHHSARGTQQLVWLLAGLLFTALLWASLASIDEFTRGEGKVVPSRHVQVVQSLDGGVVAEILVREGQSVDAGQTLLKIDDTRFASSLRESDVTIEQLQARAARLQAEAEGRNFDPDLLTQLPPALVAQEQALYQSRQQELQSRRQVLVQQVSQKRQELSELTARIEQLQRSYDLLRSELEMTRPLVAQGAISQVDLLRLERQANDLGGDLEQARLSSPRLASELAEAQEKLASVELEFKAKAREEMTNVLAERSRLSESSGVLQDRVQRTLIKSPVKGTVKQLMVKTLGGVIQPGVDIVEIVPAEDTLQVEARVRPADIAFLHPGQHAMVKFTAYDFAIHGGLEGEVIQISPDTIQDEEGHSFYLVRVETVKAYLGSDIRPLPIIPGMTVNVDILTGKKTVLDYLLKPILKTKQLALREK